MRWLWRVLALLSAFGIATGSALAGYFTGNWLGWSLVGSTAIFSGVMGWLVLRRVRRERAQQLQRGLEPESARRGMDPGFSADLRERFRDALGEIRSHLRSGVYELPWFAVLGESGSGKSALLHESGLDVPARFARRSFGPTRNCEFVLSNEAIGLDTPGHWYRPADAAELEEWKLFLRTLRQSRPDCPLNGILVALPAPVLLGRSGEEIEEEARELRRRLNELRVELAADIPVYLVVTKTDALEGFVELAQGVPSGWSQQAFGWTCEQRRVADPETTVEDALSGLSTRLDSLVPELMVRESDRARQRRLFGFSQELETLGRAVARFAGTAFKRDRYDETPFLRGVYLTSARAEGATVSTVLRRLGVAWADTPRAEGLSGGVFLRDLWREIACGDEPLALSDRRLGPGARRALALCGVLCLSAVVALWSVSFYQNLSGGRELAARAALALRSEPALPDLLLLRRSAIEQAVRARSPLQWLGFNQLERAVQRARSVYAYSFDRAFHRDTRANLERALGDPEEARVRAAIVLATDLEFLARCGGDERASPDWSEHIAVPDIDARSYQRAYAAFVSWLPRSACEAMLLEEQQMLERVSSSVLRVTQLEEMSRRGTVMAPVRYSDLGLEPPRASRSDLVPGIYTLEGARLVAQMVGAIERSGSLRAAELDAFKRQYAERYYESWRRFLFEAPLGAAASPGVKASPYPRLIETAEAQTRAEFPAGALESPEWVGLVRALILRESETDEADSSGQDVAEPAPDSPWLRYQRALDDVALEVEPIARNGPRSLLMASDAAEGRPTALGAALDVIGGILPDSGDVETRLKLRALLKEPVRSALAQVLLAARTELDRSWSEKVVAPSRGADGERLRQLLGPSGAAERFLQQELRPFFGAGRLRQVLGELELPLGRRTLDWLVYARQPAPARVSREPLRPVDVRATSVQALEWAEQGKTPAFVRSWELRFDCPGLGDEQVFRVTTGSGRRDARMRWSDDGRCDRVSLFVELVAEDSLLEPNVSRSWTTLDAFLASGQPLQDGELEWEVRGSLGTRARVRYRIDAGDDLPQGAVLRPPPRSLAR